MQHRFLKENQENNRLILFFTGWSTNWHILDDIEIPAGYDLSCCWDYRALEVPSFQKKYKEIVIIAWSFGIKAAEYFAANSPDSKKITGLYAINGTTWPIDDAKGIPVNIFESTVKNLCEKSLEKFRLRIVGGKNKFIKFKDRLQSDLSIDELGEELNNLKKLPSYSNNIVWDYAFISENDRIFPIENLKKAWAITPHDILSDSEHFFDFQKIFNFILKDKQNISKKFEDSAHTYCDNATVQNFISKRMFEILKDTNIDVKDILEIGGGLGDLSNIINSYYKPSQYTIVDLTTARNSEIFVNLRADVETEIVNMPSENYDLVVSGSTMQWLHSPSKVIKEISRILKPGGKFIFSTFLKGNMKEIAELTGRSMLYLTHEEWQMLAQRVELKIEVSESKIIKLFFENINEVFNHLKKTGVNALTGRQNSIKELKRLIIDYPKEKEGLPLTYNTYIMMLSKN